MTTRETAEERDDRKVRTERTHAAIQKMDAERVAAGQCRHCGGKIPCWSAFGDVRPGVRDILIPPGVRTESVRLLTRAAQLREAAKISPAHAEANLADAERLERMAIQGVRPSRRLADDPRR